MKNRSYNSLLSSSFINILSIIVIVNSLLSVCVFSAGPVDTVIHFAGRLTDSGGTPKATASIKAEIYSVKPINGSLDTPVWIDIWNDEADADGNFSIMLGASNSLMLTPGTAYYLVMNVRWLATYSDPADRIFGDDSPSGDLIIVTSGGLQTGEGIVPQVLSVDSITAGAGNITVSAGNIDVTSGSVSADDIFASGTVEIGTGVYIWNDTGDLVLKDVNAGTQTLTDMISSSGVTLDGAYDLGGAGAGRIITADAGTVEIIASGPSTGLIVDQNGTNPIMILKDGGVPVLWITDIGLTHIGSSGAETVVSTNGDLYVQNAIEVDGNTYLGDAASVDTVNVNGDISIQVSKATPGLTVNQGGIGPVFEMQNSGTPLLILDTTGVMTLEHDAATNGGLRVSANSPGLWLNEENELTKGALLHFDNGLLSFVRTAGFFGASEAIPYKFNLQAPDNSLTVDSAGNVGIGTLVPSSEVHILGTVEIGTGAYLWNDSGDLTLKDGTAGSIKLVNLASGGGVTLDGAYDEGGLGAGRIITADNGTVEINASVGGGLLIDQTGTEPILRLKDAGVEVLTARGDGIVHIGDGGVENQLDGNGDLYVKDVLEVDGSAQIGDSSTADILIIQGRLEQNTGGTVTALNINQLGTGKIMDLRDSATSVFQVFDGGTVEIGTDSFIWDEGTELFFKDSIAGGAALSDLLLDTAGASSLDGAYDGGNGITADAGAVQINGSADGNNALEVTESGSGAALLLNQTFTGPIADFRDNGTTVFTVIDGGNVGVGIAAPTATLHAEGMESNPILKVNQTFTGPVADFQDNGTSVLTIIDGGNVGVGVAAPTALLHAEGMAATPILKVNQTFTGPIVEIQDGGTTILSVADGGLTRIGNLGTANFADGTGDLYVSDVLEVDGPVQLTNSIYQMTSAANTSLEINQMGSGKVVDFQKSGTSALFIDNSGRIGAGAAIPAAKMDIEANNAEPALQVNQTGVGKLADFKLSGTSTLLIDNFGKIGVGVALPAAKMDIEVSNSEPALQVNQQSSGKVVDFKAAGTSAFLIDDFGKIGAGVALPGAKIDIEYSSANPALQVNQTSTGKVVDFKAGGTSALNIANDGNIGAGVALPGAKLDIEYNAAAPALQVNQTSTGKVVDFKAAGTSAFLIDDFGRIGAGVAIPGAKLDIEYSAATPALQVNQTSTGDIADFKLSGVSAMKINNLGNVQIGTGAPSHSPDFYVTDTAEIDGGLWVAGNIHQGNGTIITPGADIAEKFYSVETLEPGDVVVIDPVSPLHMRRCTEANDTTAAGIVSTRPATIMGSHRDGQLNLALSGSVPCKVDASFGAIKPGDYLVSSDTPGHAMRAEPIDIGGVKLPPAGTVGKALEGLESGTGTITVLVITL